MRHKGNRNGSRPYTIRENLLEQRSLYSAATHIGQMATDRADGAGGGIIIAARISQQSGGQTSRDRCLAVTVQIPDQPVGGRIVAEVIVTLLDRDPTSVRFAGDDWWSRKTLLELLTTRPNR